MLNKNDYIKTGSLLVLLVLAAVYCTTKKMKLARLMANSETGLVQVKKAGNKTIVMELLPRYDLSAESNMSTAGFYKVKLVLKNDKKINGSEAMRYMNFGIKNGLYAVQGGDTLPCAICERIPGINEHEYVYMIFFNKPVDKNNMDDNLQLFVNDTIAGFGPTVFEIKSRTLKKLEAIK